MSRALRLILLLYLLLALLYSVIVPLGEAPDEVSHYAYVRWIATHQSLPEPVGAVLGEVFQPPLYYALISPLTAWQPDEGIPVEANDDHELSDPVRRIRVLLQPPAARWPWQGEALAWHIARFASPLLGLVTLLATYGLARVVLPSRPEGALLAVAFTAFMPQFTFLSGVVSNDTLSTALSALLLFTLASAVSRSRTAMAANPHAQPTPLRLWLIAGILGGLGVWTKSSGWVFVGTAGLAWLLTWQAPGKWRRVIAIGSAWALVALPWLIWNLVRTGDPLGWSLMHVVTDERVGSLTLSVLWSLLQGLYRTFWAGFGGAAHLSFPPWANLLLGVSVLVALAGLLRFTFQQRDARNIRRVLFPWLAAHFFLIVIAWLQWSRTVLGTGQGRLLFPALPAIAILLSVGWLTLLGWSRRAAFILSGTLAAFGIGTLLLFVLPLYRFPPMEAAPAVTTEAGWRIGDALLLRSYAFPWTDIRQPPDARSEIYLEWQALAPLDDLRLRLRLVNDEGEMEWLKEGTPSAGRDTSDQWQAGEAVGAWHRIEIPRGTPPGRYRLLLSVVLATSDQPLTIHGPDGRPWGPEVMIGQVTVRPE